MCNAMCEVPSLGSSGASRVVLDGPEFGAVRLGAGRASSKPRPVRADVWKAPSSGDTKLVLLGVAGGPEATHQSGIASAVVVGRHAYLVDCGANVLNQLAKADIDASGRGFSLPDSTSRPASATVRSIFLTHLHSDHVSDYFSMLLRAWPLTRIDTFGPGRMDVMPHSHVAGEFPTVDPLGITPLPGTVDMTTMSMAAFAYDINTRIRAYGRPNLEAFVHPHDIELPAGTSHVYGYEGSLPHIVNTAPRIEPFEIYPEDDNGVRVRATLVDHAPVFPSFAFRFDTPGGSIVFSGDTAPSENLIDLAQGADVLVHEAIDERWWTLYLDNLLATRGEMFGPIVTRLRNHFFHSHTFSTDVGTVAARAGVKTLALTHLGPNDDLVPKRTWSKNARQGFAGKVFVGEDLLEIQL